MPFRARTTISTSQSGDSLAAAEVSSRIAARIEEYISRKKVAPPTASRKSTGLSGKSTAKSAKDRKVRADCTLSATPKEVAEWMTTQINRFGRLLQVKAVAAIEKRFGKEFVYLSDIGEMSIDRRVLYHFNKMTHNGVVWVTRQGGGFWKGAHWRPREYGDSPGRTQYEY